MGGWGFNGKKLRYDLSDQISRQIWDDTVASNRTYIAFAKPGSLPSDAVWAIQRIEDSIADGTSTRTEIKWKDGEAEFINVATNFAIVSAFTYS